MNGPKVLIVDDELFFRQLFADLLEREGYDVEAAESGGAAINRVREGGIDLVLSDVVMPGLDGLEVLRACREIENPPEVVMVTGQATLESAIEALKRGAHDYIIKPFNPEELRHLVHTCLEQRRLLDENQNLKEQIRLYQDGQSLAGVLELDELLQQSVNRILREMKGEHGFAVVRDNNDQLQYHALTGFDLESVQGWAPRIFSCLSCADGPVVLTRDTTDMFNLEEELLVHPLCSQDDLHGVLVFTRQTQEAAVPERVVFLCRQAALGFDNAFRFQNVRKLMYTDDLTGLYNHRYLQIVLEQELRRSGRYGLEFALIFIDLDYFKSVNDRHGHLIGSAILREAGKVIGQCVRDADLLFRYGGDEFTALLVETEQRGAEVVAERIRRTLENHSFLVEGGEEVHLTATIGYAVFPADSEEKHDLLSMADRAMYWGKKERNVVRSIRDLSGL